VLAERKERHGIFFATLLRYSRPGQFRPGDLAKRRMTMTDLGALLRGMRLDGGFLRH